MNEAEAKRHLAHLLLSFTPGGVLHLLGEVIGDTERERLGGLGDVTKERVAFAEAALFVFGLGLDAMCPR